jgi:hypothetical protein
MLGSLLGLRTLTVDGTVFHDGDGRGDEGDGRGEDLLSGMMSFCRS